MNETQSDLHRTRRSHWPLALVCMLLIVIAAAVVIFWRIETWPARTAAQGTAQLEKIGRDVRTAFLDVAHLQPKVVINNRVYFEQSAPTAELATVTRETQVEHEFLHTWAGSTKRIKLRGVFLIKAGFDLHKNFSVNVRDQGIDVTMPPAQILGVEEQKVEVLTLENGYWNRISPQDIENELRALPELARRKAEEANLAGDAEKMLRDQLEVKINVRQPLHVIFAPAPPLG